MAKDSTSQMNSTSVRGAIGNDKTNAMNSGKGKAPNPRAATTDQAQKAAMKIGDFTKMGNELFKNH